MPHIGGDRDKHAATLGEAIARVNDFGLDEWIS